MPPHTRYAGPLLLESRRWEEYRVWQVRSCRRGFGLDASAARLSIYAYGRNSGTEGGPEAYKVTGDDPDNLSAHLARVNRADDKIKAVLSFVRSFGLLGYSALGGGHLAVPRDRRAEDRRRQGVERDVQLVERDDVIWALGHAQNVDLVLALLAELRNTRRLRAMLEGLRGRGGDSRPRLEQLGAHDGTRILGRRPRLQIATLTPPWQLPLSLDIDKALKGNTDVVVAHNVIAQILNVNLKTTPRVYDPLERQIVFRPKSLIEAIYQLLAERIGGTVRRCRCGAYFFARDDRQRSCPSPLGAKESRCAKRFRMQRLRKDQRTK